MTLLICNVGGKDLVCAGLSKVRRSERGWAEELLARYDDLQPMIDLPIIGKALRYFVAQEIALERLILIASDQDATQVEQRFWESDTCLTATIIARYLADGYAGLPPIPAEQMSIWIIRDSAGQGGDPADYDLVLAWLEQQLVQLAIDHPNGSAFLQVTGGTPAMTTGLLIAGTEAFGARAELLSIHPQKEEPTRLNTGQRLLAAPLRATLRSNAATYAYDAALTTLYEQRAIIGDRLAPGALATIAALLAYAQCRYSFDFPGARAALAVLPATHPWAAQLAPFAAQVAAPDRTDLLAEVIHGAAARYTVGLYADFLTQLVRFEENLLRLLCLERGAIFVSRESGQDDDDGSLISRAWLRTLPFSLRNDHDDGRNRSGGRAVLRELLGRLAHARGEVLNPLLNAIDKLQKLVYLRNETTHSLDGVDKRALAIAFTDRRTADAVEADGIIPHLAALYQQIAGRSLPSSPYKALNGLLDQLLRSDGGLF
jgi:hypothetical protein